MNIHSHLACSLYKFHALAQQQHSRAISGRIWPTFLDPLHPAGPLGIVVLASPHTCETCKLHNRYFIKYCLVLFHYSSSPSLSTYSSLITSIFIP